MGLTPWQLLLWIAGLELISIPLLIFLVNAIFVGWFRAKEQHQIRLMRVFREIADALIKAIETINSKKEENKSES